MPAPAARATAGAAPRRRGLGPVVDTGVRTLILGSFPGAASLQARQYYAHPRNQFWRIMGCVLDEPLAELDYASRLQRLLAHGIGLWDVIGACTRSGSLDADIREPRPNRLDALSRLAPRLAAIGFNGQTAARYQRMIRDSGYLVSVLPSSSPAHASRSFEQKLAAWQAFFERAGEALK